MASIGEIRNGIQYRFTDSNAKVKSRNINGVNIADDVVDTDNVVDKGGYTAQAVYEFGTAIASLVGVSALDEIAITQTKPVE